MSYGFQRTATGRIVLRVDQVERGLLASVARQVIDLVKPEEPTGTLTRSLRRSAG